MPAKTRAQIEAQIAALQGELDGADTDDEVWLQEDGGPAVRVTGKRATSVLNRYAHMWADDEPEGDPEPEPDPEPQGAGIFKRRGGNQPAK